MRKLLLLFAAVAAMSFTAKAQWYAGGSAGLGLTASEKTHFGWNISPEGGYKINDSFAAGVALNFGGASESEKEDDVVFNYGEFRFNVMPYVRWEFAYVGDLCFALDGRVAIGTNAYNTKATQGANSTKYTGSAFSWGVAVAPVIKYEFAIGWSLVTTIASLGVSGESKYNMYGGTGTTSLGPYGGKTRFSFMAINGPSIGVEYSF